jgi:hypothetical protein
VVYALYGRTHSRLGLRGGADAEGVRVRKESRNTP